MDYKKSKRQREFDRPLPRPSFMTSGTPKGYCERVPGIMLRCQRNYQCWDCDIADRVKYNLGADPPPHPPIDERSVFMDKGRKQYNYFRKIVAVRSETLESLGYKPLLYYQLFKCEDGPGCLPGNTVWEIDGYFIAEPDKPVTLRRSDILGIPTFAVFKKYDKYFFANTVKESGYMEGGGVI